MDLLELLICFRQKQRCIKLKIVLPAVTAGTLVQVRVLIIIVQVAALTVLIPVNRQQVIRRILPVHQ